MSTTTYCTILARNYLPRALSLAESLRRHHPDATLVILMIEAVTDDELPSVDGVRLASLAILGLETRRTLELAASYDLVELATAVKPLLLLALLRETPNAVYLDPDTYVTSPMVELEPAVESSVNGIVLTPHFLDPVPAGSGLGEGHLLHVGVFNLGFCAVSRRSQAFLEWWWSHLEYECLHDPLSGLFVDQKWVDVGSALFAATAWQHRGYNVGVGNIHERPLVVDGDGLLVASSGDRLRLFHFHSFDTSAPEQLTTRFDTSTAEVRAASSALDDLCREYCEVLLRHEGAFEPVDRYRFATDTRGRRLVRATRRVYRRQRRSGAASMPSPFLADEADRWDAWRRQARRQVARDLIGDGAKSLRCALPDEYAMAKSRLPGLIRRVRGRYVEDEGSWA